MKMLALIPVLLTVAFPAPAHGQVLYDDLNHPFSLINPPQRIVSLAPNITEILFALGLGERVIGVTRYCDFPPQAAEKERVGGMIDPNLEKIQSLRPDLIIAFRGNPLRLLNKLRNLHFPVFVLNIGISLDALFPIIEKIGRLTQAEMQAESLISTLKNKYKRTQEALQAVDQSPKVFLSLPGQGLWTCGKESYLNDLLSKAKAVNIAGEIPREWFHLNREQIIHENPEMIIIMAKTRKDFLRTKEGLLKKAHLKNVKAVKNGAIFFLDENTASRFGPRLFDAYIAVARILHPQQFGTGE